MSKRLRILRSDLVSRVALISITAGALAGCSGSVERFGGEPIYTGSTSNQRQILSNGQRQPTYQDIMNGNGGTVAGLPPASSAPVSTGSIPNNGPSASVGARSQSSAIVSRPLAAPVQSTNTAAPRVVASAPAPVSAAPRGQGRSWKGWTAAGGTQVPVRNGETVDVLSKRYGVPAQAIVAVNGIEDPSQVRPGQNLIIPVYVYGGTSQQASAPQHLPSSSGNDQLVTGSINPTATSTERSPQTKPQRQPSFAEVSSGYGGQATATDAAPIRISVTPEPKPRSYLASRTVTTNRNPQPEVASVERVSVNAPVPQSAPASLSHSSQPTTQTARTETTTQPVAQPAVKVERQQIASVQPTEQDTAGQGGTSAEGFRWPVRGRIISGYGMKPGGSRNDGINLSVPEGTPVHAASDGTVIYSGNELKGYGNLVLLRHENGWVSAYAHNSKLNVKRGDKVRRGDIVAEAGATGSVSRPQVHFELRKGNKPVDPMQYLPKS